MNIDERLKEGFKGYDKKNDNFIEWLNIVKKIDNECFLAIRNIMPIFEGFTKGHAHPKTHFAFLNFVIHLNTIKNGIIDLAETDNVYGVHILYRVFLEHWLKGIYIWTRYLKEKTDEVGVEYIDTGRIGDDLKYGDSIKKISKILEAEENKKSVWGVMCEFNPKLKKINQSDLENKIKKFEYRRIVKYLVDNNAPGSDLALSIISEYSELSAYIHGSPRAADYYGLKTINHDQFEEYKGMIRFSFNMSRSYAFSVFSLMLTNLDDKNKKILLPLLLKLKENNEEIY